MECALRKAPSTKSRHFSPLVSDGHPPIPIKDMRTFVFTALLSLLYSCTTPPSRALAMFTHKLPQVGLALSGFPHNGVSVFGGLTPIPIIVSEAVRGLRPAFVWMGAGHPLLKLGVSASDLEAKLGAIAADISVPRDGVGVDDAADSGFP